MAQTIRTFVNSTRLWYRLFHGGVSLASHALVLGVALMVLGLFWPTLYQPAVWIAVAWLVLLLAFHALRRGASLQATDRSLGLRDQLVTWWEMRAEPANAASQWLEEDLGRVLEDLPPASRSPLWRSSARRLWWLLPALLLVWWIGPIGGFLGVPSETGDSRQADAGAPRDVDDKPGPGAGTGALSASPEPGEREARAQPSPKPRPPQPRAQPAVPPTRSESRPPPRPLHTLKAKDEFVIPRFLGDGEGETRRMKVAVLEEGPGAREQRRREQSAAKVAQDNRRQEFEAAAEQARRARHVPPSERAFVKRYFRALLQERR